MSVKYNNYTVYLKTLSHGHLQGRSQGFESGSPKWGIMKVVGVQCLKRDHYIFSLQLF